MVRQARLPLAILCLGALGLSRLTCERTAARAAPPVRSAPPLERAFARLMQALDGSRLSRQGALHVATLGDGDRAELTLDPELQRRVEQRLQALGAPYAAVVVLSVADGRVLALAGHSTAEPGRSAAALTLQPWAPAASIFKLVTAAALVEGGVGPKTEVCYHGGLQSVQPANLRDDPVRDRTCNSLAFGLAKSQNAIVARLAHDHLDRGALARTAHALGFGVPLALRLPVAPSALELPDDALELARAAAGFWHTTLSPLHGAWLAATLARGGLTPPLHLVARFVDRTGKILEPPRPEERQVIPAAAARAVARMMEGTVEYGTARHGFFDRRTGRALLPGVAVAGKTGSLSRRDPYLAYSWFVGFAPVARPQVALAVLLGNGELWRAKAHQVAEQVLADYFATVPAGEHVAVR